MSLPPSTMQSIMAHFNIPTRKMIDVGALDGGNAVQYAKFFDHVYVIDPIAEFAPYHQKLPKNCQAFEMAASDHTGQAELLVPYLSSGRAHLPFATLSPDNDMAAQSIIQCAYIVKRSVTVSCLDDLVPHDHVDYMAIDVEGGEYAVIHGALKILKTCPLINITMSPLKNPKMQSIFDIMGVMGYRPYHMDHNNLISLANAPNIVELTHGRSDRDVLNIIFYRATIA